MPAQTPAITRSSELGSNVRSDMRPHRTARSTLNGPGADMRVEHEHARAGLDQVAFDVAPVGAQAVGELDLADLGRAVDSQRDVGRHDHVQVTDVDSRVDVRLARRSCRSPRSSVMEPIPSR